MTLPTTQQARVALEIERRISQWQSKGAARWTTDIFMLRIGLIGVGAIGASLAEQWSGGGEHGSLTALLVRPSQISQAHKMVKNGALVTDNSAVFFNSELDVVVEAAGHAAVREYGCETLERGRDLCVLSAGALADEQLRRRLQAAAKQGRKRLVIPAGALAGFDGLQSLSADGLSYVKYTSTKPPAAWRGTIAEETVRLDRLTAPSVVFRGSAREAAQRFPKNANLAAAVALAGLGFDDTEVELIADPDATENRGRLVAASTNSRLDVTMSGAGCGDNPKTSRITAMSVVACLRNQIAAIGFG
jgi:aspartate dehydrogenase